MLQVCLELSSGSYAFQLFGVSEWEGVKLVQVPSTKPWRVDWCSMHKNGSTMYIRFYSITISPEQMIDIMHECPHAFVQWPWFDISVLTDRRVFSEKWKYLKASTQSIQDHANIFQEKVCRKNCLKFLPPLSMTHFCVNFALQNQPFEEVLEMVIFQLVMLVFRECNSHKKLRGKRLKVRWKKSPGPVRCPVLKQKAICWKRSGQAPNWPNWSGFPGKKRVVGVFGGKNRGFWFGGLVWFVVF